MWKRALTTIFSEAITACQESHLLSSGLTVPIEWQHPKSAGHGDLSTNIAMILSKAAKKSPREVSSLILSHLGNKTDVIQKCDVAGPGFINVWLQPAFLTRCLGDIISLDGAFGQTEAGRGKKVLIEFVSANPTGPLHVGHGRGAVYGDVLAAIMTRAGYEVQKEYYLNDAGVQMQILGRSVWLRLKELEGETAVFPEDHYQGPYIREIAKSILSSPDYPKLRAKGEEAFVAHCSDYAGTIILDEIRQDMAASGIFFDSYYSESTLHREKKVDAALKALGEHVYQQDGAIWFRSTTFGDEKDRVLKKSTGEYTYFAADIAYHLEKFRRGVDLSIDIWGADHAGHVPRMKYAVTALGHNPEQLQCVLIQLVNLIRDGQMVSMSTRRATYETFRELVDEVGRDVCRYFFLMRSHNVKLDFDMKLATSTSMDNPVYYIQYANARIHSVFKKAEERGYLWNAAAIEPRLTLPEEVALAKELLDYPEMIALAASELEPHRVAFYLLEISRKFQSYYSMGNQDTAYRIVTENKQESLSKLYLLKCIQIVIQNGLKLLGISAPTEMRRNSDE